MTCHEIQMLLSKEFLFSCILPTNPVRLQSCGAPLIQRAETAPQPKGVGNLASAQIVPVGSGRLSVKGRHQDVVLTIGQLHPSPPGHHRMVRADAKLVPSLLER